MAHAHSSAASLACAHCRTCSLSVHGHFADGMMALAALIVPLTARFPSKRTSLNTDTEERAVLLERVRSRCCAELCSAGLADITCSARRILLEAVHAVVEVEAACCCSQKWFELTRRMDGWSLISAQRLGRIVRRCVLENVSASRSAGNRPHPPFRLPGLWHKGVRERPHLALWSRHRCGVIGPRWWSLLAEDAREHRRKTNMFRKHENVPHRKDCPRHFVPFLV